MQQPGPLNFSRITAQDLIAGLSRALDLTEGEPLGHSIRACWIGMAIGRELGLSLDVENQLYFALLLKDAGCSANSYQVSTWFGTDDHAAKSDLKTVNWSNLYHASRYAIRNAKRGGRPAARLRQMVAVAKRGPQAAHQLVEMRCNRGAEISLWASKANRFPSSGESYFWRGP